MDTNFWNNLIVGYKVEEEVAQWLESFGYSVWRLGTYRLPIDLYCWKGDKEFLVEVKYRTGFPSKYRHNTFQKAALKAQPLMEESQLPLLIIVKTLKGIWLKWFILKPIYVLEKGDLDEVFLR